MRDLVISHAGLVLDTEMPPLLLHLCAHVSGYEITAARWGTTTSTSQRSVDK
jgi:hypothetical protein